MSSSKEQSFLKNPITSEDIIKIKKVFHTLENDNQAIDFLEPVDYIGLNLLDYPTIIKHPMDLSTAKSKLLKNEYSTFQDFYNDIDLIWKNCKTYNREGSEIVKMANHCEKVFKKQMEKQFKNYIISSGKKEKNEYKTNINNIEGGLSMTEKMNLTDKIRILSNDGLTQVVKLIMKECPNGIEDLDSEKLQIKIDLLDYRTYELINQYLEKNGGNNLNNNDKNKSAKK
jgi:bromodomain-containing factor 1